MERRLGEGWRSRGDRSHQADSARRTPDEEQLIEATLASVHRQTRPPDRVIVIADNCSDRTADVARSRGADVVETVGNTQKKAGALNQTLATLLPSLGEGDLVLVMDADTQLADEFVETAVKVMEHRHDAGAIGGVFHGDDTPGLVGALQRNEYARYAREIYRRGGRAVVLRGRPACSGPRCSAK